MTEDGTRNIKEVQAFLDNLRNADWLDASRRWWPRFVYHFTDVRNAVSILEQGALFSRNGALRQNLMATDNASQQVLAQTSYHWKDYVRLYFRPRTPTQYRNEGFRPSVHHALGSHCPMPVYFLFDSQTVLLYPNIRFSNGNLGSGHSEIFSTMAELRQLPFTDIYHDAPLPVDEARRQQIITRRQAEVIIPNRLGLDALRFIVCRSPAERDSLIHLLTPKYHDQWLSKVLVDPQHHVFLKRWLYVETVEFSSSSIVFHFNLSSDSEYNGPFHAVASITDMPNGKRFTWQSEEFTAKSQLTLWDIPSLDDYSAEFTLDGQIAYAGRYRNDWQGLPW